MAEELRGYYNELLDNAGNSESFGTPLTNVSDDLLHIREVTLTLISDSANVQEGAMIEGTKRAARSQSVGHQPPSQRVALEGSSVAVDNIMVKQKTWKFARGQLTLETGESYHNHHTNLQGAAAYDSMVDIAYHY